jgi:formamidopyrimidine-DNA glycosylase
MPELPEVERAATMLRAALVGRTILQARTLHPSLARTLTPSACRALRGRRVERVTRRAKHQLVHLDDLGVLEIHFKMTGDWYFGRMDDRAPAHERARLVCDDGTRVSLVDARALAVMRLHAPGKLQLPPLGPEPFDPVFTGSVLRAALATRTSSIKQQLLDQRIVAGLGNIYGAEALWEARISPETSAASLSAARCARLVAAIRLVLERAPAERYYEPASPSEPGATARSRLTDPWRVYGREGEPCVVCGARIRRIMQGGRSTYFCPRCQRN